jgi:hypothetical protein
VGKVETAISTEALNRIIKEVERPHTARTCELIELLAHEEQNSQEQIMREPGTLKGTVKYMAPDFDDSAPSSLSPHEEESEADTATLRAWLNGARNVRAELPLTSDSVDILRELREVRSRQ